MLLFLQLSEESFRNNGISLCLTLFTDLHYYFGRTYHLIPTILKTITFLWLQLSGHSTSHNLATWSRIQSRKSKSNKLSNSIYITSCQSFRPFKQPQSKSAIWDNEPIITICVVSSSSIRKLALLIPILLSACSIQSDAHTSMQDLFLSDLYVFPITSQAILGALEFFWRVWAI